MKLFKTIPLYCLLIVFAVSCQDGYIDDITPVSPGDDTESPSIEIMYPEEGTEFVDPVNPSADISSINIQYEVTDDIEVASITITLDGTDLTTISGDFTDYRKVIGEYLYEDLTFGDHTLTISSVDMDGNEGSETVNFTKVPYLPKYDGEIFYMPFDGNPGSTVELVTLTNPTIVGNPGFAGTGKAGGNSYAGATDSYLTFPADSMMTTNELSAVFWMNINNTPDRAGILVIGPPDTENADYPATQNLRTSGFRFFRENGADGNQRFKLNVGTGSGESWFDGGANADVDPTTGEWVHFAFSISATQATVYINGEVVSQGDFPGMSWADCDILSIMSGSPRFNGWGHLADLSYMDELRIFNKALSQAEVQTIIADED